MFRLVVIYQLVLSLLVGPMLCCCTAAQLGHDAERLSKAAGEPVRKHCCGQGQNPASGGNDAPSDQKPGDPTKCPCKDGTAQVVAVPEGKAWSADPLSLLTLVSTSFDLPSAFDALSRAARPAPRFDHCASCLSTEQLLFAHHNLRC